MTEGILSTSGIPLATTMMDLSVFRQKALASNLANIATPGHKRVDLSETFATQFQEALRRQETSQALAMQPTLEVDRDSAPTRPDGNNVSMEKELLSMSSNAMQFEYFSEYLNQSIRDVRAAITGRI